MKPEERARIDIDKKLTLSGWTVQSYHDFNPSSGNGIAVTEYPTESGFADYILFIERKPVGVIEAKKVGETLSGVHEQTVRYATDKLKFLVNKNELPYQYESTGTETFYTDARDPVPRQREIFCFHRPETLNEWIKQSFSLRSRLKNFPPLIKDGFRNCQTKAIENLEISFADNRPRALVQMATGAGKTFTAITSVYRLLKFANAKRVLFLVDTRNLGKQAEQEFQAYKPNDDKRLFTELYNVQRLRSNFIDPSAQVCISTIQRMYSILKGKELDESLEDESPYETKVIDKPVDVVYNPNFPIETFDFIIIDECHRSIYNLWKQVLDYFDAFMIGLTATPDKRTFAFFHENIVSEYTLKQSIADKVNVGYDVYTIETDITQHGAEIKAKQYVDLRNKSTRKKEWKELEDDIKYEPTQLDREIVNPSQIRNIIREYKRILKEEFFLERGNDDEVPKTLIFAKTDSHAEDIVHIVREEFGESNDFCKKITYNVKNEDPESILQQFRTAYYPRIAVTVDMIATGTDVKPIEVLIFMRDVRSRNYFQQMIGRGTRSLSKEELVKITPGAKLNKERFYIIDAVGVFKSVKVDYPVVDKKPSVPLKDLMKMVMLQPDEENTSSLAARLTKIDKQISDADREKFKELTGGKSITQVAVELANLYDPDFQYEKVGQIFNLSKDEEPTPEQIQSAMEPVIQSAIHPFDNPTLRDFVETVRQKIYQIIDTVNIDKITFSGFDSRAKENAEDVINNFRKFIEENKNEIIALKILYDQPYRRKELTLKMISELKELLASPPYALTAEKIWNAYHRLEPQKVTGLTAARILTDIISLIRYEIGIDKELKPYSEIVNVNFKNWIFRRQAVGQIFTEEQLEWLRMIRNHIVTSVRIEKEDFEYTPFVDNGGLGKFWKLFGEETEKIITELNEELVA
ncbi:MAG: type I restriction-modification enzyme R subunit C-terminal domain-containing protein [Bacteroidota bacterium]